MEWLLVERSVVKITKLRATFENKKVAVHSHSPVKGRKAHVINIDLTGLKRGVYFARIRYSVTFLRGARKGETVKRTKVHLYRACYGKFGDPNQFTTTIL